MKQPWWDVTLYDDEDEEVGTVRELTYSQMVALMKALARVDANASAVEYTIGPGNPPISDSRTGSEKHVGDRQYV